MDKQALFSYLDTEKERFFAFSDFVFDHPELSLQEFQAAEAYESFLRREGFTVEHGTAGIATAFTASYGAGRPIIGILGEYDALDRLSQQSGVAEPCPLVNGGAGHGCGHNLLGAAALAAACAVKEQLKQNGSGTVIFFGCPGEEGGSGKAFMARDGLFTRLDAAVTWHPSDCNEVVSGSCLASYQIEYSFAGVAAHAAGQPYMGRSALDAVTLMNVGAQFLREHIPPHHGLHYAVTDTGGVSPNVVQPTAQVLYMLRSDNVPGIKKLAQRVDDIARGAALMTGTTLRRRFIDGTAETVPCEALEKLAYENLAALPLPEYTEEEWAFAAELRKTYETDGLVSEAAKESREIARYVEKMSENGQRPLADFLVPLHHSNRIAAGSTDVGDVSHSTPTVQFHVTTVPAGTPGHSWQQVAMGKTSIAKKGLLLAAKAMAGTVFDLLTQPDALAAIQAEYRRENTTGYVSPLEDGAVPTIPGKAL